MSATAWASIGDQGVLNTKLSQSLSDVRIDRDLSWLDFNDRVTWLLVPQKIDDSVKKADILALLRWVLTSGQKECSALGYAPLPREIAAQQLQLVSSFK